MIELNDIVLSDEKFKTLSNYLDGTDFNGVEYNKGETLLEYGFLYDSRSGEVIVTHPIHVWNEKEVPIMFGITNIPREDIIKSFRKESARILIENDLSLPKWEGLCDEYKINIIENTTMGLDLSNVKLDMSIDDLLDYLKTKI